jgi:hypothetical protein
MGEAMRTVLAIAAIMTMGAMTAAYAAEETTMFPDASGKMVRIKVAHSFEECMANGRKLGYPDIQSRGYCASHCNGTICQ